MPPSLVPVAAWAGTVAEIVLGIGLLTGFTRFFATASGILLVVFAVSMTISTGIKSAFAYSVYSASAASFLLAGQSRTIHP